MKTEIINKIKSIEESLNPKQQNILKSSIIDPNFDFFENMVNGSQELFFRDKKTGNIYHFVTYIKKTCGCD